MMQRILAMHIKHQERPLQSADDAPASLLGVISQSASPARLREGVMSGRSQDELLLLEWLCLR